VVLWCGFFLYPVCLIFSVRTNFSPLRSIIFPPVKFVARVLLVTLAVVGREAKPRPLFALVSFMEDEGRENRWLVVALAGRENSTLSLAAEPKSFGILSTRFSLSCMGMVMMSCMALLFWLIR